ncbi:MAG: rod shape-determining protein MreC [Candidatus Ratteibacteria bacterium]|nr:rod shape-determining protein MreC [Candidatus Ratteibacteria bacterium]
MKYKVKNFRIHQSSNLCSTFELTIMLWRFRREVIFIVCIAISVVIVRHHYVRKVDGIENIRKEESQIINYEELIAENIRLKEILDIKKDISSLKKTVIGQVVSIKPYVFPVEIVINKGREDGIKENMTVLSKDMFLIGRVVSVDRDSASVMTIFNKKSKISVVIGSTRDIGILEGGNIPFLFVRYIPYDSYVQIGDNVLTSGYSDFYPKGIKVGEITKIERSSDTLFLKIYVKPFSCISDIEEVVIGE